MRTCLFRALALSFLPTLAGAASFIPLEITLGAFYDTRLPLAISADGSTVVSAMYVNNQEQAVRWTNGGSPQFLGLLPGGESSLATGVSADGSVIVGSGRLSGGGDRRGFRSTAAGGMQGLGGEPSGQYSDNVNGVSGNGDVVVGNDNHNFDGGAFRWTETGGRQYIGTLPYGGTRHSEALAISADGAVIVGQSSGVVGASSGKQAFRWTASSGITALSPLSGATTTHAGAASADGSVIVGNSFVPGCFECGTLSRNNAVSWTDQGPATLLGQVPGGDQGSSALAVSADGSVIVGHYFVNANDPFRGFRAFVWTAGDGMQKLFDVLTVQGVTTMTGWTLLTARGVSADGLTITGQGLNPNGQAQAFVVTLNAVPIPAAAWLFGGALSLLGFARRRSNG